MGTRHLRARVPGGRGAQRGKFGSAPKAKGQATLPRADRKSLLLGTALASTLIVGVMVAPTPAAAVQTCFFDILPFINHTGVNDSIDCLNFLPRVGIVVDAIGLSTINPDHPIELINTATGILFATGVNANGIYTHTAGARSQIIINNSGAIATADFLNADGISAETVGNASPISIVNSAPIATIGASAEGISTETSGGNSGITIINSGPIASAGADARGILARSGGVASSVTVVNSGPIATVGGTSAGLSAYAVGFGSDVSVVNSGPIATAGFASAGVVVAGSPNSHISVTNSGDIATLGVSSIGIFARSFFANASLAIDNSGDIATLGVNAFGIRARTYASNNDISIVSSGDITTAGFRAHAISGYTQLDSSGISIVNSGDLLATGGETAGISAVTAGVGSPISIANSGFIDPDIGIYAYTHAANSPIDIENSNRIEANRVGIVGLSTGANSGVKIVNSGDINSGRQALLAYSNGAGSPVFLENAGDIVSQDTGMKAGAYGAQSSVILINTGTITSAGDGMYARATGDSSSVSVVNTGDIAAKTGPYTTGDGIYAETIAADSPIDIVNQGNIKAEDDGIDARTYGANSSITITNSGVIDPDVGVYVLALGDGSRNLIINSGSVFGEFAGILSISYTGTKIVNTGDIAASSFFAIGVSGASAEILNSGKIIGFVDLTENSDTFINQKHGVFETKLTSYFNGGDDLFRNEAGGTVRAATNHAVTEHSAFEGLERFENNGLITMQDKREGDSFLISNTPGGTDLVFTASSKSTLAVDAFLGAPGSTSDTFIIEGDARGQTRLDVHNTNPGPGSSNKEGIPVVFVDGAVKKDAFFLKQPIDTGFFAYDLFFKPTGSGIFELRTVTGASAHILPHLVTNVQDAFHSTTDTWFDRTADLRVLLNGGPAPVAYDPDAKYAEGPPSGGNITPAVWVRGGAEWIGREGTETTKEFGHTYEYKLDGDLNVADFQTGLDLGKRDVLSQGDILVFGVLGGFVHADLDFDAVGRQFNMSGVQAGAYATYLKGGLFVDTLFKADFLDHEQNLIGFPGGIDATSFGVRTDTGYRFGSFGGGAFIEPLATLGVVWSDLDDFALGGNKIDFDEDPNVRGRLGLRVGTSMGVWAGTTMEPFVIGSVWGDLSGDRSASIVSNGDTYNFEHDPEDVWGEVSAGVNFFNPSASTAVFAKLDVTFGEDLEGFGGKAGMRVSW